jgi:diketogulonate reductase-like aldo/keto reductase
MPFAGHFFLFRPAILTAIDLSLKRLGVDSIDLYMVCFSLIPASTLADIKIHGPLTIHSFESMASQLVTAYKAGSIKAVGVSNFSKDELYVPSSRKLLSK